MKVYIANFGRNNWAWKDCLEKESIAVMDDVDLHEYWLRRDRDGYIARAQQLFNKSKPVCSRWYSLNDIMINTSNDIWVHGDKEYLWWTKSGSHPAERITIQDPKPIRSNGRIHVYFKKCDKWRNTDSKGRKLLWGNIHPRARDFLFTEGTCQNLGPDNAGFTLALISGDDLSHWLQKSDWVDKEKRLNYQNTRIYDPWQKTIWRMVNTAIQTCEQSGKETSKTTKTKKFLFSSAAECEKYVNELRVEQDGICALTGIPLDSDDNSNNSEFSSSLDRIDSNGHYEIGNLQLVCKFANRWKSNDDNDVFLSLIRSIIEVNNS